MPSLNLRLMKKEDINYEKQAVAIQKSINYSEKIQSFRETRKSKKMFVDNDFII